MYRIHGMKHFPLVSLGIDKVAVDNIIGNQLHSYGHVVQY